jgi:hypothetical protein
VAYKCSELGIQWVQRNKENALKKKYHHTLGQGGYKVGRRWSKICLIEVSHLQPGLNVQEASFMVMAKP